jgi:single-stranded-DNA-specific exonuclease
VIGIVASRLVEAHRRPAALIAAPPGELARGSARSLVGIDITAAIAACQERLASFGGHPMAAGFALESKNIPAFRKDLSAAVEAQLSESWVEPALEIDGRLELGELTLELVADLERLSPFGPGNRIPVLAAGGLRLRSLRNLGRNAEHRQMAVDDQEASYKVIWWGGGDVDSPEWLKEGSLFDLAYTARRTDFRGRKELQLEWVDARPVEGTAVDIRAARPPIHVEDYRRAEHPLPELKRLLEEGDLLIWAEGDARTRLTAEGIPAVDRTGLTSCARLAVWTPPPGREIFQSALETVSPETVCLFAVDPGMDKMEPFLQRLAGLAKYALRTNAGRASISSLASATAQRASVVGAGLAWLEAQGSLKLVSTGGDEVVLGEQEKGDQGAKGIGERGGLDQISKQVRTLLTETAAFRAYYLRAEGEGLIGEEPGEQGSR